MSGEDAVDLTLMQIPEAQGQFPAGAAENGQIGSIVT